MAGRGGRRWRLVRARRDALAPSVRRWYSRLGARVRSERVRTGPRTGPALVRRWWLPIVAGLVLAGMLGWVIFQTPVLGVRRVQVDGSRIASPAAVLATADVVLGTPLARVDTGAVAARVAALPSVAAVDVHRSWPSTLVIVVTERVAVAVVADGGRYLVLDDAGVVFDRVARPPVGVVLVRLTTPGPGDAATRAGLQVVAALTAALRAAVREVVVTTPSSIELRLRDGRVVVWGDASQSPRKAQAATALLGRAAHRIDVSAPDVLVTS